MSNNNTNNASFSFGGGFSMVLLFGILLFFKTDPFDNMDTPLEGLSWWIVTAPLWAGLALMVLILLGVGIFAIIAMFVEKRNRRKFQALRQARAANRSNRSDRFN